MYGAATILETQSRLGMVTIRSLTSCVSLMSVGCLISWLLSFKVAEVEKFVDEINFQFLEQDTDEYFMIAGGILNLEIPRHEQRRVCGNNLPVNNVIMEIVIHF